MARARRSAVLRYATGAAVISAALGTLSAAVMLPGGPLTELRNYLDVAGEANLPTWWSTALLTVTAVTYGVVGLAARLGGAPSRFWVVGAVLLALLSLCEHTGLHERVDGVGMQLVGPSPLTTDWLPLAAAAAVAVALAMALLAPRAGGGSEWLAVGGLALLLVSVLGGEIAARLWLARVDLEHAGHVLTYHGAEFGENLGAVLLLAAAATTVTVTRDGGVLRLRHRDAPVRVPAPAPQPVTGGVR